MDVKTYMQAIGQRARQSSFAMARAATAIKNKALFTIAEILEQQIHVLLKANAKDMAAGEDLDAALLDRLELNEARVRAMVDSLRQVAALPDPIGEISGLHRRPSGIQVGKMRVPLGVIGIIYESRPDVTQVEAEERTPRLVIIVELVPVQLDAAAKDVAVGVEQPERLAGCLRGRGQPTSKRVEQVPKVVETMSRGDEERLSERRHSA